MNAGAAYACGAEGHAEASEKKSLKFLFKKKHAGAAYACGAQGHAEASESSGCRSKIVSGCKARWHAYVAGTRTLLVQNKSTDVFFADFFFFFLVGTGDI